MDNCVNQTKLAQIVAKTTSILTPSAKSSCSFFAVSTTPLSHCILKQLLGNPRNCKNIIDFTQSYHSGKATRQATHFYNTIIRIESQSVSVRAIQDIIQCPRQMYNVKGHSWGRVELDTTQRGFLGIMLTQRVYYYLTPPLCVVSKCI